ncbi:hypothetical protein ACFOQM_11705 [Paenibacillus sp. GCM10012307]|uniref:MacB-like periplasmic core domain-containing protein n=1 Tax=Paenibacillus roseus TaxID=2798579 RepID=A0A934IZ81_9BACL|nr:hypothetical protein [Paenibacillus roseus]MBJ6361951.1 hypothetical protein [Paenibacillus roseus]
MKVRKLLFKQTPYLNVLSGVAAILFCSLILVLILNLQKSNIETTAAHQFNGKNVYQISDNLYNEQEKLFFSNPNSFSILYQFGQKLRQSNKFDYYNAVWQPIELADFKIDQQFGPYYEPGRGLQIREFEGKSYATVASFQINAKVFEYNNIGLQEGSFFSSNSYFFEEDKDIPILLGAAYKGIYQVGDRLELLHYSRHFNGVVTGILKPQQRIFTMNDPEAVIDRSVILPVRYFKEPPKNTEGIFAKASLYSHMNGTIITNLSPMELRAALEPINVESNFEAYSIIGAESLSILALSKMTDTNRLLLFIVSITTGFMLAGLYLWTLSLLIKRNIPVYMVMLISGATMDSIQMLSSRRLMLTIGITSLFPTTLLIIIVENPFYFLVVYYMVIVIVVLLLVGMVKLMSKKLFRRLDLVQQLKG